MNEKVVWLACNPWSQIKVFETKPIRQKDRWKGIPNYAMTIALNQMEMCGFQLPRLTWEDEPVELKITLNYETTQNA